MERTRITLKSVTTGLFLCGFLGNYTVADVNYYNDTRISQYKTAKYNPGKNILLNIPSIELPTLSTGEISSIERTDAAILENFAMSILNNIKPLDSDIAQFVNENFWDLV